MLDSLTIPRRTFDFEDYIDIVRRNMRWIIAPAFLGLVISTVVAYVMEDTYTSSALIRVTPQQISPELMSSITSQDVADRINSLSQTILSRNTLTNLVTTYGLYKKDLAKEPMEDVIEKMKHSVSIVPIGGTSAGQKFLPAMRVGFSYSDPYVAQRVCSDLVSRFVNLGSVEMDATTQQAAQLIDDELASAKRDLDQLDEKLAEFRGKNAGHLPEELQLNMQQMNALDSRMQTLNEAANRNSEQRLMLDQELRIAKDRLTSIKSPQYQAQNEKVVLLDREIEASENRIAELKERYTDDYPDLQNARDQLVFLKKQRDAAAKEKPVRSDIVSENPQTGRDRQEAQDTVDRLQTRMKANAMDGQIVNKDLASVNADIRNYQSRLQGTPAGDKEYSDLMRDRDLAKQRFLEMSAKAEKANVAIGMQNHKQGETLELLDSASLPTQPVAPKRRTILPIGAVVGLLVGIIAVAVREVKDTSLKNLKDAKLYTQLSILGSIPLLENDVVVQRRKQVMWVGWATATLAGIAVMAVSVAHYYWSKGH